MPHDAQDLVIVGLRRRVAELERGRADILVHVANTQRRNDLLQQRLDEAMGREAARQVAAEAGALRAPSDVVEACVAEAGLPAASWDIGRIYTEKGVAAPVDVEAQVDDIMAWAARQGRGIADRVPSRPVELWMGRRAGQSFSGVSFIQEQPDPAPPPRLGGPLYRAALHVLVTEKGTAVTARELAAAMDLDRVRAAECWLQRNARRVGRQLRRGNTGRPGNLYLPKDKP